MTAEIFPGVHVSMQTHITQRPYSELINNINYEVNKAGGYFLWRDACIMENSKNNMDCVLAYRRFSHNTYRWKNSNWTQQQDVFLLRNLNKGIPYIANGLSKSDAAIRGRISVLHGSLVAYIRNQH